MNAGNCCGGFLKKSDKYVHHRGTENTEEYKVNTNMAECPSRAGVLAAQPRGLDFLFFDFFPNSLCPLCLCGEM